MASSESTEERLRAGLADRYRIEREIGSGGMATVYLAEDLKLGRQVAIKFLSTGQVSDTEATARFTQEAQAASALGHLEVVLGGAEVRRLDRVEVVRGEVRGFLLG